MSKMRTPTMEVVRFTQSDVIVASGAAPVPTGSITFGLFNNGIAKDGYAEFDGTTYTFNKSTNANNFANAVKSYYNTNQYFNFYDNGNSLGSTYSISFEYGHSVFAKR